MDVNNLHRGCTTQYQLPNTWFLNPCFSPKADAEVVVVVAGAVAAGVITPTPNLNHLNDIQPDTSLPVPGPQRIVNSGNPSISQLKPLSVSPLPERVETPCHSLPERQKTPCLLSLPEREKTLRVQSPPEGEKTLCVQSKSVFIHEQPPVGGRLSQFVSQWELNKAHPAILGIIKEGYKLPFRERPKLTRQPFIVSGYVDSNRQNALSTSIQDLLMKKAIEQVHTKDSLGYYSRLFLVPKPNNRWRPVIDLSALNKYLTVLKFKMETLESITATLKKRRVDYLNRPHGCLLTRAYSSSLSKIL